MPLHKILIFAFVAIFSTGCSTGTSLYNPKQDEQLTVAKAQRDIKIGMSSAEVVSVLGSPNIISTDSERNEVWVYDKISTQQAVVSTSGGISILIAGVGGSGASSVRNQRTLTIIVKFNSEYKVKDISYHTSSF